MHCAPKAVAGRVSVHFGTGWGGCHRSGPTGGAANGMPLKDLTPPASVPPSTGPAAVTTRSVAGGLAGQEISRHSAARRCFMDEAYRLFHVFDGHQDLAGAHEPELAARD